MLYRNKRKKHVPEPVQLGVERRWRLTRTDLPPELLRVCGFTGTIFLPARVFAIFLTSFFLNLEIEQSPYLGKLCAAE
jgi:hypothetical protein